MSIPITCDMYLRLGLHMQIRLHYVLSYKAKISAQHGIGFVLDRCIVYLGLTMPNLQKKRLLIFEIFNIKKCTLFLGTEYSYPSFSIKEKLMHSSAGIRIQFSWSAILILEKRDFPLNLNATQPFTSLNIW